VGGTCGTNGGDYLIYVIGRKGRGKETTRNGVVWIGLVWLRIGTGGELL
jgi:hypothetical protein